MMKNTAVRLLCSTLFITSLLAGCSSDESKSDEDFLNSVREDAAKDPNKGSEDGNIDPNTGSIADIELETIMFELGQVSNSEFTFKEMYIFNKGKAPLEIKNITTTCPCTTGTMKEGDTVIEPESEGVMIIKYDPARSGSYFTLKKLTIHSNDPHRPMVYVDVTAHVERDFLIVPEKMPVTTFEEGEGGEIDIRIVQNGDAPLELFGLHLLEKSVFLQPEIELVPESEWANKEHKEYIITLKVLPTTPIGIHKNDIMLDTNVHRARKITIPFEVRVAGNYIFEPGEVTLRGVESGTPIENVLTLNSKLPLSITSVKSVNNNIKVEHTLSEDGLSATFDIVVPERPENRLQKDTWTITFKSGEQEVTSEINVVALLSRQ